MTRLRIAVPAGGFQRIAVLRLSSLGDVVLTLPAVHALARAFPGARMSYWTKEEYADAVRFDAAIGHVRSLEPDARRFEDLVSMSAELEACDLIVDLHGSLRSRLLCFRQRALVLRAPSSRLARERWVHGRWTRPRPAPHALERYGAALRPIGVEVTGVPEVTAGAEAEAWADAWLAAWAPAARPVALCPGARHFTKRWPEAHWIALDAALRALGCARLYLSLASERRALPVLAHAIEGDPAARWVTEPLPRLAALLSRCATAVTGDSGLMHLAAARGLGVVALFGSTAPELGFAPSGAGHEVICRHEPCQPCTIHGRARCPRGHFRCMEGIVPAGVARAVARLSDGR
jgi:heptosyltransferase-2